MIHAVKNNQVNEHFTVSDRGGNLISGIDSTEFSVYIYDPTGIEVSFLISGSIIELGNGNYKYIFTPTLNGVWYITITHPVYFPWGKSNDIYVDEIDITEIYNITRKILGLTHENIYIDQPIYGVHGSLISARLRIYSNANSIGTDSDIIETYRIESNEIESGKFSFWSQAVII